MEELKFKVLFNGVHRDIYADGDETASYLTKEATAKMPEIEGVTYVLKTFDNKATVPAATFLKNLSTDAVYVVEPAVADGASTSESPAANPLPIESVDEVDPIAAPNDEITVFVKVFLKESTVKLGINKEDEVNVEGGYVTVGMQVDRNDAIGSIKAKIKALQNIPIEWYYLDNELDETETFSHHNIGNNAIISLNKWAVGI